MATRPNYLAPDERCKERAGAFAIDELWTIRLEVVASDGKPQTTSLQFEERIWVHGEDQYIRVTNVT